MEGAPERGANEKGFRILWIIWAAMLGSLFIYVVICHQWGDEIRQTSSPDFPLDVMRKILYGIAIFTLILTHFELKSNVVYEKIRRRFEFPLYHQ
jgi:hypothetical protein